MKHTTDNMTTTTRWNKLFNWRFADISKTPILDEATRWNTYVLSAPAWGLKGKLPGGRHSWIAKKTHEGQWRTVEITDLETLQYQKAIPIYHKYADPYIRQVIVSDRDPSTMWFGNMPRVDATFDTTFIPFSQLDSYPLNEKINLLTNNCNTFVSYMAWQNYWKLDLPYVGFRQPEYWEIMLDKHTKIRYNY